MDAPTTQYTGTDALAFVSRKLKRRHPTKGQAALVALKIETLQHGGQRSTVPAEQDAFLHLGPEPAVTHTEAAALMGVSPRYVDKAKDLTRDGTPDLMKAVGHGKMSPSASAPSAALGTRSAPTASG